MTPIEDRLAATVRCGVIHSGDDQERLIAHKQAAEAVAEIRDLRNQNKLLKEKLVEERARAIVRFDGRTVDIPDDMMQHARQQLQAEGKIGVGDHIQVTPKMVWQVTEERKEALGAILEYISYDAHDDIEICGHAAVLRAMLDEASV